MAPSIGSAAHARPGHVGPCIGFIACARAGTPPRLKPSRRSAPGPRRSARDRRSGRSRGPRSCLPSRPRARGGGSRRPSAGRSTGNVARGSRRFDAPRRGPARPSARRARGSPARSPARRRSPGAALAPREALGIAVEEAGLEPHLDERLGHLPGIGREQAADLNGYARLSATVPGNGRAFCKTRPTFRRTSRTGSAVRAVKSPMIRPALGLRGDSRAATRCSCPNRTPDHHIPRLRLELQLDPTQNLHLPAKDPDSLQPQDFAGWPEGLDACRRRGSCPHRTPFILNRDVTSIPPDAEFNPIRPALARKRKRAADPEDRVRRSSCGSSNPPSPAGSGCPKGG